MAQAMPPTHICSFDKLVDMSVIGRGGFGQVYEAKHKDWGPVAYKELPVIYVSTPRSIAELDKEVAVHKMLRHSNIVTLMALVYDPRHKGIIMQFEQYGDALRFLRDFFPVDWAWKLKMTHDIVLGMNYLHTQPRPLIHGDLKAKNVLIGSGYRAKIADFGLAFWKQLTADITQVNPGGTVTHIPPECWRNINGRRTEKFDVYAFGVLLWELLAYPNPLYPRMAADAIATAVLRGLRPPLTDIQADVPAFLNVVVQDSWEHDPSHRPTFRVLKDKLDVQLKTFEREIKNAQKKLQQCERDRAARTPAAVLAAAPARTNHAAGAQVVDNSRTVLGAAAAAPVRTNHAAGAQVVDNLNLRAEPLTNHIAVTERGDGGTAHGVSVQDAGSTGPGIAVQDRGSFVTGPQPQQVQGNRSTLSTAVGGVSVQDGTFTGRGMSVQDPGSTTFGQQVQDGRLSIASFPTSAQDLRSGVTQQLGNMVLVEDSIDDHVVNAGERQTGVAFQEVGSGGRLAADWEANDAMLSCPPQQHAVGGLHRTYQVSSNAANVSGNGLERRAAAGSSNNSPAARHSHVPRTMPTAEPVENRELSERPYSETTASESYPTECLDNSRTLTTPQLALYAAGLLTVDRQRQQLHHNYSGDDGHGSSQQPSDSTEHMEIP